MSNTALISVGVGVLAGAAAFFTGGASLVWALAAFSVASTVTAMLLGPDTPKNGTTRPDEIQINQSAEDAVIPVVFGTTRLAGNFIYVGFDEFASTPLTAKSGEGKSETTQQVGFRYTVPISYGICMGEIDSLIRILGSPGQDKMADFGFPGLTFTGGDPETIDVEFVKKDGDTERLEGGTAIFYPGSSNQGSATTTDKNHRNVCWIDFPKYTIDGSPAPRTLLFEVHRLPKVLDGNGDNIVGIRKRGSGDDTHKEYYDANPAAVAWEVLRNGIWGKGMSAGQLDQESFMSASQYYQDHRIGYSSALGQTTLTELMARLREIFGLWVWWDGQIMRARCIYDLEGKYEQRPIIQADDVIGSPTFTRPSLSGTSNEIRLTFTNRNNNYQQEVATAMDLAHVETIGGIRTQSVDGSEIGSRRAAELLAHAMLRQMAYPAASCTLKVRRTYSGLQPGAFIQLRWDEWREGTMAKTFWRVVDIEDDDQGTEGITLTLMEDIYATAKFTEDDNWDEPEGTIDSDDPVDDADLVLTPPSERVTGPITPVILWEPNSYLTAGTRRIAALPSKTNSYIQSVTVQYQHLGAGATALLGSTTALPFNGTIMDAIPATGSNLNRDAGTQFRIEFYTPAHAATVAANTGLVQTAADHFATLANANQCLLLIDGELFRVGFAEVTATGVVTIRTFMRAEGGTIKEAHSIGAIACFFDLLDPSQLLEASALPTGSAVNLYLTPSTTGNDADIVATPAPADLSGYTFNGRSIRPFEPELKSATRAANEWTIRIRPRMWGKGAGTKLTPQDDFYSLITDLTGLSLQFQKSSGGGIVTVPAGTSYASPPFAMPTGISVDSLTWIPDTGAEDTGLIQAVITFDVNPPSLQIWGIRDGLQSSAPLSIPQP